MSMDESYTVAKYIEKSRLGNLASGIPTIGDQNLADDIDHLYEQEFAKRLKAALDRERKISDAKVKEARYTALNDAVKVFSTESVGFQAGWGSNEMDQAKLDILGKAYSWLKARRDKYVDVLPRWINLRDTYEDLSDGAKIEVDSVIWTHRKGFGTFNAETDSGVIHARSFNKQVKLLDHNL